MRVDLKLDENCKEPRIIVVAKSLTEEISALIERLSNETPQSIVGFDGKDVCILDIASIVRIYSAVGKVFAVTDKKEFILRLRMYEVEERLAGNSFVRISNSEIINIKKAKKFDLSMVGTIGVALSNGDKSFVSRRYVTKIKNFLGI